MPAPNDPAVIAIAALLGQTGQAHHQAFAATNGEDPELDQPAGADRRARQSRAPGADWPVYYAEQLMAWYGCP
jgi:hypothetical protein